MSTVEHIELEVGAELEQAFRTAITMFGQVGERLARQSAERSREVAASAREQWLTGRDSARAQFGPFVRPGVVERSHRVDAARAWEHAAGWADKDPQAAAAADVLHARITAHHRSTPQQILSSIDPQHRAGPVPAGRISMGEVMDLAQVNAPYYYARHTNPRLGRIGQEPANPAQEQLHEDWQHFAENGTLPQRSQWETWAGTHGHADQYAPQQWEGPYGAVEHDRRDAALRQEWNEGAGERDRREISEHLDAMSRAGMDTGAFYADLGQPAAQQAAAAGAAALTDPAAFDRATPTEAAAAWVGARGQGLAGDEASMLVASELDQQFRRRFKVSPQQLMIDAATDRAANTATQQRAVADRARERNEQSPTATAATPGVVDLAKRPAGSREQTPSVPLDPDSYLMPRTPAGSRGMRAAGLDDPVEAAHRHSAWSIAQNRFSAATIAETGTLKPGEAWDKLPQETRSKLYWTAYDSEDSRWISQNRAAELADPAVFDELVRERAIAHRAYGQDAVTRLDQSPAATVTSTDAGAEPAVERGPDAAPSAPAAVSPQSDVVTSRPLSAPVVAPLTGAEPRGVAPTKAPTPAERVHRSAAWAIAERDYERQNRGDDGAGATWKDLPVPERYARYWSAYDSPEARDVTGTGQQPAREAASDTVNGVSRARVVELNDQAAQWYGDQLRPGTPGHEYLRDRVGQQVMDDGPWQLGYAPPGWSHLRAHLRAGGASDEEIVGAGLGTVSSRGNVIDAFRDRVMIGIRDDAGEVVGFVGRDLSGDARAPKYVNTTHTSAFTKGDTMLGLHEAADGARLARVEGPFDAIAVTAAGNGQVAGVAPLGTALTDRQADYLAHRAPGKKVWVANDNDAAGKAATESDFWSLADKGVDARLVSLPNGSDPAQLWRENPDLLREVLAFPDVAPTAGLAVMDHAFEQDSEGLRAGDVDAFDRIDMTERDVRKALTNDVDDAFVQGYTSTSLAQLREQRTPVTDATADPGQEPSPTLDAAAAPASSAHVDPGVAPSPATPTVAMDGQAPYDRGAVPDTVQITDAERYARRASGHAFSKPTAQMVADAQQSKGRAAKPSPQNGPSAGQNKTQRR